MKKIVIDIDGVLNDYPKTQLDFFNLEYHPGYNVKTLSQLKTILSYNEYNVMKKAYRQSEYKHNCKPKAYAKELLQYLRDNGYLIYIITARKLFMYNQLERTILWLKNNDLCYDYIYCSQKKDFTIFEKFGKIDAVIEDNCDNLQKIQNINGDAKYFLVSNPDNLDKDTSSCIRVTTLKEIITYLKKETDYDSHKHTD